MTYATSSSTASNSTIPSKSPWTPPSDLKSALSIAFNVILHASKETNRTQTFNYFNVFLAPYIRGNEVAKIKGKPAPLHTEPQPTRRSHVGAGAFDSKVNCRKRSHRTTRQSKRQIRRLSPRKANS